MSVGRLEDSYIERYREYKYKETLYEMFAKQFELARVDEAREGAIIQVIDPAQPPERKAKPYKAMIAVMASLISGLVLLFFVLVRQAFSTVGRNSEDAQKLLQLKKSWRKTLGLT